MTSSSCLVELRVLEGPNLYFPRAAIKLTLDIGVLAAASEENAVRFARRIGLRNPRPGAADSGFRQRFAARAVARLVRAVAAESGTAKLAVRVRPTSDPHRLVVAYPWRHRERAQVMGRAVAEVLDALPSTEIEDVVSRAAERVAASAPGAAPHTITPRVPVVAVTGTNGKTTTARMIAHIFKGLGRKVGMTSTDGVVIDERLVIKADASGPKSARMVLQNPRVDFAVMEVARGGILREGLGYDRNDVAVVTNVAPDHLGMRGINTLEQLAAVKAVVVEAVPRDGFAVLNADDALVRAMRRRCSGSVVWFSLQPPGSEEREFIDEQCRRGGRAVVLEPTEKGDMITIRHGRRSMQLAWTHLLPSTFGGAARMNVANALAAAGAAFAAGAPLHDIRQGLRTFTTSYYLSPGRMNLLDVHHVDVVVDYCHNAPGMRMLGDFVESYSAQKAGQADLAKASRIGMIGAAGDRRDDDIRELGMVAADHFDVIVIREDHRLRGREAGVAAQLVAEGIRARMAEGGARCRQIEIVLEELDAVRHCMARANPGDLVVLCVDHHATVLGELEQLTSSAQAGAHEGTRPGDPDLNPRALQDAAEVSGAEAAAGER